MNRIKDNLWPFIENYGSSFLIINLLDNNLIYANKRAKKEFNLNEDSCDYLNIFKPTNSAENILTTIKDMLSTDMNTLIPNQVVKTTEGVEIFVDIQIGYFTLDNTQIFLEFIPKNDTRMKIALYQINQTTRPEAIINYDDNLSIVYCNDNFNKLFELNENLRQNHFDNCLINVFLPEVRDELINDILTNLKTKEYYSTKIKVYNTKNEECWYLLEFEKHTLDNSGVDKLITYITNINNQIQIEVENPLLLNQYMTAMQETTDAIIYRMDLQAQIIYFSKQVENIHGIGQVVDNSKENVFLVKNMIHQDDIQTYLESFVFFDTAVDFYTYRIRISINSPEFEWHEIYFKKIYDTDGNLIEVFATMLNIHKEVTMKEEFSTLNQYFNAMQNLSHTSIFRVNIEDMSYHYNDIETSKEVIIPDFVNNFIENKNILPEDADLYRTYIDDMISGKSMQHEIKAIMPNGKYEWLSAKAQFIYNEQNEAIEILGLMENIHKRKALELRATYDQMTNVLSKVTFGEQVTEILEDSIKGQNHAIIFIDLDDFKGVNDTLGHAFGDELLITVAKRLKSIVREYDLVGRLGGDEFVVFLKDIQDENIAMDRCDLILEILQKNFVFQNTKRTIKASLGVAMYPKHSETFADLLDKSDQALYISKGKGKNIVTMYNAEFLL